VSIIDEDYMQAYVTMNQMVTSPYGSVEFEDTEDGMIRPKVANAIKVGKWDLIFLARPKSGSMSSERLKQNVEVLKILQSTDPELVKYLVPDILKDTEGQGAKKIRDIIMQREAQQQNSPEAQANAQLQEANARLEMMLKQSQANLNNTKAQTMIERNKIDLQKAFSKSLIDKQAIQVKNDKNQLDAMRRIV